MRRTLAIAAILCATAIAAAQAQGRTNHPDFSGTWVLDYARSDSSSYTPKSATYWLAQQGDSLIVDRETVMSGKTRSVYLLNGHARKNMLRLVGTEAEATSLVTWRGDSLVVNTSSMPAGKPLIQRDTWTVSADRMTLRIHRESRYDGHAMESPTLVLVKH